MHAHAHTQIRHTHTHTHMHAHTRTHTHTHMHAHTHTHTKAATDVEGATTDVEGEKEPSPPEMPKKDPSSFTLVEAAQYGVLERCRELVERGKADVTKPDSEGITCLHWAAINNRLPVARCVCVWVWVWVWVWVCVRVGVCVYVCVCVCVVGG